MKFDFKHFEKYFHEHVFYNIILTGVVSFRLFRVCNRILSIIFSSPFSPYIPLLKTDTRTKLRDTGSFVMEDIWIIKLKIVDIACFWYIMAPLILTIII